MSLSGRVCIVTGASRGIGKGIAMQLGEAGATVYITGRTLSSNEGTTGSLQETAKEIKARGGKCIPVQCDHTRDEDVEALFKRVREEQSGRLDLLVNNAYSAVKFLSDNFNKKFYQTPIDAWDTVNNVGLRNHYLCTWHATQSMVEQKHGLIVWVSSVGGLRYLFNVAYGVGKAACDRMAADCAFELRGTGVTCISLWPGAVRTETVMESMKDPKAKSFGGKRLQSMFENGESTEFAGKAVVALLSDPQVNKKTGRILITSDLASEYGFKDVDGRYPQSMRSVSTLLMMGNPFSQWMAKFCPSWVKIPKWLMHFGSYKF